MLTQGYKKNNHFRYEGGYFYNCKYCLNVSLTICLM